MTRGCRGGDAIPAPSEGLSLVEEDPRGRGPPQAVAWLRVGTGGGRLQTMLWQSGQDNPHVEQSDDAVLHH